MHKPTRVFTCGAFACLTLLAGNSTFTAINFCATCFTEPIGINNKGQIAGTYFDADGNSHGFLKDGGAYKSFDIEGTVFMEAGHINNNGQIAGDYVNGDDGIDRPFVRNADGTLDLRPGYPDASVTYGITINDNGLLTGSYTLDPNAETGFTGFIMSGKRFVQTFAFPAPKVRNTFALDINNAGTVVGSFQTTTPGEEHGFIRTANGAFQRVDYPGSVQTELLGINDAGVVLGRYQDSRGVEHGFQMRGDVFTPIDSTQNPNTWPWGINSSDEIVGYSYPTEQERAFTGFQVSATTAIATPRNAVTSLTQIQLDGTSSIAAGGKPLTWLWTLASGSPNAIVSGANTATPIVQFFAGPGTYRFTLTVTDANGKSASDTVPVVYEYRR